jgi:hypothetical protein
MTQCLLKYWENGSRIKMEGTGLKDSQDHFSSKMNCAGYSSFLNLKLKVILPAFHVDLNSYYTREIAYWGPPTLNTKISVAREVEDIPIGNQICTSRRPMVQIPIRTAEDIQSFGRNDNLMY